ncbi:MAG: hypothetical protein WCW40_08920 [Bacteroidota bacterium]
MRRLTVLQLLLVLTAVADAEEFSISLKGTFTTSTRFLYNVDRPATFGNERTLTSNFGYGADIRWNILWDRFFIGFSIEKITGNELRNELYSQYHFLPVPNEEGFEVLAMEMSGYYIVPVSSENIKFYLGGGIGTYDGRRNYSIANVRAETISSTSYLGIHVMTGIDYRILERVMLRFEIKFRDPHFDITTNFDQTSAEYLGYTIRLPQGEEVTKVNLFGVNYVGGLVFTL